ncbi:hypothetical protein AVEN_91497-1 [Araneus ventricosus]|uniref:Uncharacterized protein n=1 Tax=Araneus ventricosus TaxID=182803 RepID=A0A4Y2BKL3_ARAVE|nr:hypothetical protein AVEN_91497-1 [Araneus ventricosus]
MYVLFTFNGFYFRPKPVVKSRYCAYVLRDFYYSSIRLSVTALCADQLAKDAITTGDPFFLPKPLSYLKSEIRSAALSISQDNWDNGEIGRSTHDIVPTVSNKPLGWNREELMFVTGHGPFPSYLHRFNLRTHDNRSCGGKEIQCTMPQNVGLPFPGISKLLQWMKNILTNNLSRTRLRLLMRFICDENNLIAEDNH